MATATPRKQRTRIRSVLLVGYGILALGLSVVLAGTILVRPDAASTQLGGSSPSSSSTSAPITSSQPTFSTTPPSTTPTAEPTAAPVGAQPNSPSSDNPFGMPLWMLQVLFAFTTLSGLASILRFMWETLARFVRLFQR